MDLFKQLGWYFLREWKQYLIALFLLICISILQLFPPKLVGLLIDSITKKEINSTQTLSWAAIILFIAIVVYMLRYMWRIFLFGAAYRLATELRIKIYDCISKENQTFYLKYKTGDLITRITSDVDKVVFAAGEGVLTLIDSLVMGLSILTTMIIYINWKLTICSLLPMPIMVIAINKIGTKIHYSFQEAQTAFSYLTNHTQESLSSIDLIKSFGLEEYRIKKFFKILKHLRKRNTKVAKIDAMFDPIIHLSISLSNLLAIVIGGWLFWKKIISIGQLTSFIIYLGLMIWPMLALAWMFNIVERGSVAWKRIQSILNQNKLKEKKYAKIPTYLEKLNINIKSFYYYKCTTKILKNINFSLYPGQTIGICGPTGSGKSTLLKLIQQQFPISNGKISYNSIPISRFNIRKWRKKISVIDQTTFLFSDTIYNNILIGKMHASQQEIEQVIHLAHLHNDIINFPCGYNTQVGERGMMLSGGQKQRISIARALLAKSEILILDNALSAIDGDTESKILKNFNSFIKQKRTIIICTHRLSSLINANNIIVLKNGTIIQKGKHNELIQEQKKWYNTMYSYQKNLGI
ncbi:MAG: ABC transporter transmembrane domain-containing protein [Buchnera aphidicola (Kaburagia rhusicola rhusicola)]